MTSSFTFNRCGRKGQGILAQRGGFALIFVLGIISLVVVVCVGFLLRASTERQASGGYLAMTDARQMADVALGLVQAQINNATTRGSDVAWTSQPGMIRTFTSSGSLFRAYKLYSAADMVSSSVGITSTGQSVDVAPSNWASHLAAWVDLNAPVKANNITHYPIVDPAAGGSNLADSSDNTLAEGFSITSAPGATTLQPAPMPVRWLYLLKDGTLVASITGGSDDTASVSGASATNPIVGRVAFWTDDESCRVNINTASSGTYWSTPRATTQQEKDFGNYQPANHEFQRYPGHPAMTDLKAVFPSLSSDQIYSIVPRIVGGGSEGGTAVAAGAINTDTDRLYATVEELLFKPDHTQVNSGLSATDVERAGFFLTAYSRAPETNLYNLPRMACWPIYKVGASGVPDSSHTTAFDRLIAFCASTGTVSSSGYHPFFFQRENSHSSTNDINLSRNVQLYSYLQYLTAKAIPGFGTATFATKYGNDRDQILTEIFDYIRCTNLYDDYLSAGNQFTEGRNTTAGSEQVINQGHGWVVPAYKATNDTMGMGRAYTISELAIGFICNAVADDPATATDESQGSNATTNAVLGGTPLASGEKIIQAIIIPELFSPMLGFTPMRPDMTVRITGLSALKVTDSAGNVRSLFSTALGSSDYASFNVQVTGLFGGRYWGGNPHWRYFGYGLSGSSAINKGSPARPPLPADSGTLYPFIGDPVKLKVPATGGTMSFGGGTLTVEIYSTDGTPVSANLIQTMQIILPAGTFPVPDLVSSGTAASTSGGVSTTATSMQSWWGYSKQGVVSGSPGRLNYVSSNPGVATNASGALAGAFFRQEFDTVRTVLPEHGDYRLVAARRTVPDSVFSKHRYYDDLTRRMASNLTGQGGSGTDQGYDMGGKYISSLDYGTGYMPDTPSNATGTNSPETFGDFDNGLPWSPDGAYCNKPDEGSTYRINATDVPYFDNIARQKDVGQTFFSPNRQIPSPGMFGSLPTGVKANIPWRTLLFRKQDSHFGSGTTSTNKPADHLWLDLFWMPVVEPYAISDRFSTAGKINLNYQILPFTYIDRPTAMRAVLRDEKVGAIPNTISTTYRSSVTNTTTRLPVDAKETLLQFTDKFKTGDVFKSASEICSVHIVPQGQTATGMTAFWSQNALTGDNLREQVYTTLYPRLTTKSNVYTVYIRAQSLKKVKGSEATVWTEGRDVVTGECRSSVTIERYIDPDADIPDYAASPSAGYDTLDTFYKWRVLQNRKFAP